MSRTRVTRVAAAVFWAPGLTMEVIRGRLYVAPGGASLIAWSTAPSAGGLAARRRWVAAVAVAGVVGSVGLLVATWVPLAVLTAVTDITRTVLWPLFALLLLPQLPTFWAVGRDLPARVWIARNLPRHRVLVESLAAGDDRASATQLILAARQSLGEIGLPVAIIARTPLLAAQYERLRFTPTANPRVLVARPVGVWPGEPARHR